MQHLKTHLQVREGGDAEAQAQWKAEGLTLNKVKFCDGLMLSKSREYDFTKDTDDVDCKKCQKKIQLWFENGFDLPSST